MSVVAALQTIWGAWKTNTPDPTSNLAGWSSTQTKFCEYLDPDSNATEVPTWRGVQCTFYCNFTGSEKYLDPNCTIRQAYLIGMYEFFSFFQNTKIRCSGTVMLKSKIYFQY